MVPNFDDTGSSSLHGGGGDITNVAIQDLCPLDVNEHLLIGTIDPVAYALAIDAIDHPGPADPSRVAPSCLGLMPGINPLTFATDLASATAVLASTIAEYPHVDSEPPLACYVLAAGCPVPSTSSDTKGARAKSCKRTHRGAGKRHAKKRKGCKRHKKRRKQGSL